MTNGHFDGSGTADELFYGINDLERKKLQIKVVLESVMQYVWDDASKRILDSDVVENRPTHHRDVYEYPRGACGKPILVKSIHGEWRISYSWRNHNGHCYLALFYNDKEFFPRHGPCRTPPSDEVAGMHSDLTHFLHGMVEEFPRLPSLLKPFLDAGRALKSK